MNRDVTTNMTQMDGGEFVCYYCFYWQLFTVSRWTYIEPHGKNYQADTDALNKNLVQYRGEAGLSKNLL